MKIIFLGHSLIEYYDWQARFPYHAVENLGVAGETTAGLLGRIDAIAAGRRAPDAVFVMTGTNDLLLGEGDVIDRIGEIARKLRRYYPKALVILQSILPVHPEWAPPTQLMRFNAHIGRVAAEENVEFLDLTLPFTADGGNPRHGVLLNDGVHLSEEGYRLWSQAVEELLRTADR